MMLNLGGSAAVFAHRRSPVRTTVCLASGINAEQLRAQLDQLHSEAESTRAKANNARLRLMRLSEAAEKLQRHALTSIQTGRENDARELLFQKKKVMQALEKSKNRIHLLDELSTKLNEAISTKENRLVGAVSLDLALVREDASPTVRIVSPKDESSGNSDENEEFGPKCIVLCEDQESQVGGQGQTELSSDYDPNNPETIWNEADVVLSLKGISSYEEFLKHLDQQLSNIEAELRIVLKFSTMILEGGEKPKNLKVQQASEILEGVRLMRGRIASIMQTEAGIR